MHLKAPLKTKNPLNVLWNSVVLYRLMKTYHINVVHARSRGPAWSAYLATRFAKLFTSIKFVTSYHGTYNAGNFLKRWYNGVMIKGDVVIAISKFIEKHIECQYEHSHALANICTVPEGVDTTIYSPTAVSPERIGVIKEKYALDANVPVIVLPGRLTPWKGQGVLLKALQSLQAMPLQVLLIGDAQGRTAYLEHLQALVQTLPEGIKVQFVTHEADLPAVYTCSDIVLSCSTDPEAFGRVTAEALAMGKAVIATQHGGSIELSNNGKLATLVPPGDSLVLANAIQAVLAKGRTVTHVNEDARAYIQQFYSLDVMIQEMNELYIK